MIEKIVILAFCLLVSSACKSSKTLFSDTPVNTTYNQEYENSILEYTGELHKADYERLKRVIEPALADTIPKGNTILIHFRQAAKHCISMRKNGKNYLDGLINILEMSARVSAES